MGMFGQTLRAANGDVTIRRTVGYEDPYTTIVIQSGTRDEIRGFTYSLGEYIPGSVGGTSASRAETNLVISNGLTDGAEWLGLEMGIPVASPARFQEDPRGGDYPVLLADVTQFVTKAHVTLYHNSDRAFASYAASTLDVRQSAARFYQQLAFQSPLRYLKNERLWLAVDWPGQGVPPVFGIHPKTGKPGVLTVTFKLLTKLPQGTDAAPVEIKADLASIVDLLREQNQRISDLIARMPLVDTRGVTVSAADTTRILAEERRRTMEALDNPVRFSGTVPSGSVAEQATRTEGNMTDAESPIDAERFRGLEKGDSR